jgi:hypothetical protein
MVLKSEGPLHPFSLRFKDKQIDLLYTYSYSDKVFKCALILTTIRLIRLIFSSFITDATKK